MKKLMFVLCAFMLVCGYSLQAQADGTINFDELTNIGDYISTEYAPAVEFIDHPGGFGVDGVITNGTWNGLSAHSGSVFLSADGEETGESGGFVIYFSEPVDSASFWWASPASSFYLVWVGNWTPGEPLGTLTTVTSGIVPGAWTQVNASGVGQFNLLLIGPPGGGSAVLDDLSWTGGPTLVVPPAFDGTGIQITGLSSNIMEGVTAGDTVTFTVNALTATGMGPLNYRFFTRKGYESIADAANPWGGNKWQLQQNWSTMNTASITFAEPGFYFMAVHFSEDTTWSAAAGGPQTGMVVEVWPAQ